MRSMASPVDASAASSQLRPTSSPLQPPLHTMDVDEEDDSVKQLKECAAVYLSLQDCLAETNRDWKSCQKHVQALKACHGRRSHSEKK